MLYEEKGGKITRMWLKPDADKLGSDPYAGEVSTLKSCLNCEKEDILAAGEAYKQFEAFSNWFRYFKYEFMTIYISIYIYLPKSILVRV